MLIEILGYLATLIALISFTMKDIIKLRIVNLIACIMFIVYGSIINNIPTISVNAGVALIQIYNLIIINKNIKNE